jgi:hypothetical protein
MAICTVPGGDHGGDGSQIEDATASVGDTRDSVRKIGCVKFLGQGDSTTITALDAGVANSESTVAMATTGGR